MRCSTLAERMLDRAQREISPLMWRLPSTVTRDHLRILDLVRDMEAGWLYVPWETSNHALSEVNGWQLCVGVDAAALEPRRSSAVQDRLAMLGRDRCEAVMIEGASSGQIKAGGTFHRLNQLRDGRVTSLFFMDAPDYATAEWMVNHTPAHAVCLDFGLRDQTARFRLLEEARTFGTGIIARPPQRAVWEVDSVDEALDVAFILGENAVISVMLDLPADEQELTRIVEAAAHPMTEARTQEWWERFTRVVQPPPMPQRSGPPEVGA